MPSPASLRIAFAAALVALTTQAGETRPRTPLTIFLVDGVVAEAAPGVELPADAVCIRQEPDGLVARCDSEPSSTGRPASITVVDAGTGKGIGGARIWRIAAGLDLPLLDRSLITTSADGHSSIDVGPGETLRIWKAGYEPRAIAAERIGRTSTVALLPAATATVRFIHRNDFADGVRVAYRREEEGPLPSFGWVETSAPGVLSVDGFGAQRLRVDVIDDRFVFESHLFPAGAHEIELRESRPIEGLVVDENDRAVEGAQVTLLLELAQSPPHFRSRSKTTDEHGRFELRGAAGGDVRLRVEKDGYAVSDSIAAIRGSLLRVRLRPVPPLQLLVRGDRGKVDSFSVLHRDTLKRWESSDGSPLTIRTLERNAPLVLEVDSPGYATVRVDVPPDATVVPVRLESAAAVRFRLRDMENGEIIDSAIVEVEKSGAVSTKKLNRTSDSMQLSIGHPARASLRIYAPGYLPFSVSVPATVETDLGDLYLDRGATLSGIVIDRRSGEPVGGARVETVWKHPLGYEHARRRRLLHSVETGTDGRFRLSGLSSGTPCVTLSHPSIPPRPLQVRELEEGAVRDAGFIAMDGTTVVSGTVSDSDGGVAGVIVELRSGPARAPCSRNTTISGEKGEYSFPAVSAGRYALTAVRDRRIAAMRFVEIAENTDAVKEDIRLALRVIRGSISVAGSPRQLDGFLEIRPEEYGDFVPPVLFERTLVPGAQPRQTMLSELPDIAHASVDAAGLIEGEDIVTSGPAIVSYRRNDGASFLERITVDESEGPLELHLRFAGRAAEVRVIDEHAAPVERVRLFVETAEGRVIREVVTAGGRAVIEAVPTGRHRIRAATAELEGSVWIEEGEEQVAVEIEMKTRNDEGFDVVVRSQAGPVPAANVLVTDRRGFTMIRPTGSDGVARFSGVRGGAVRVLLLLPNGIIHDAGSTTAGAGSRRFVVDAPETGNRVVVAEAEAHAGHLVYFYTSDGISLMPLLGAYGAVPVVDIDGTAVGPLVSKGEWGVRLGTGGSVARIQSGTDRIECTPRRCN